MVEGLLQNFQRYWFSLTFNNFLDSINRGVFACRKIYFQIIKGTIVCRKNLIEDFPGTFWKGIDLIFVLIHIILKEWSGTLQSMLLLLLLLYLDEISLENQWDNAKAFLLLISYVKLFLNNILSCFYIFPILFILNFPS